MMFMLSLPKSAKIGDTVDCRINAEPKKVTWKDEHTLVIEPGDARRILIASAEGDLICFMCGDADGAGVVVFADEDGNIGSVGGE